MNVVPQIAEWIGRRILAYEGAAMSTAEVRPEDASQKEVAR